MNETQQPSQQRDTGVPVEVRGLRKSFGGVPVLKGIDLEVQAGEIFVVMGPSGSGKSVLLKHIVGLEQPDDGQIYIGDDLLGADSEHVMDKYRIGMVFQSGALLNSLTVGENVGLYLTEHRLNEPEQIAQIVKDKLELVGLEGVEDKYPSELSGGMKKRVAIARALVIEPQLLLYDEPTSELDPIMAVVISDEILSLNQRTGATSIVVSHDRDLAFGIADRIAILFHGEILFVGTPDEVKRHSDPEIKEFIHADFKRKHV
jgi:phospholipid/cholesterol/gamma-HCH transport system ATP-binding protein